MLLLPSRNHIGGVSLSYVQVVAVCDRDPGLLLYQVSIRVLFNLDTALTWHRVWYIEERRVFLLEILARSRLILE